jgi:hypothetical protein
VREVVERYEGHRLPETGDLFREGEGDHIEGCLTSFNLAMHALATNSIKTFVSRSMRVVLRFAN